MCRNVATRNQWPSLEVETSKRLMLRARNRDEGLNALTASSNLELRRSGRLFHYPGQPYHELNLGFKHIP